MKRYPLSILRRTSPIADFASSRALMRISAVCFRYFDSNLPDDLVPPSDFDAPVSATSNGKDSSATAIVASASIELFLSTGALHDKHTHTSVRAWLASFMHHGQGSVLPAGIVNLFVDGVGLLGMTVVLDEMWCCRGFSFLSKQISSVHPTPTQRPLFSTIVCQLFRPTQDDAAYLIKGQNYLSALLVADYYLPDATDGYQSILRRATAAWGDPEVGATFGDYFLLECMVRGVRSGWVGEGGGGGGGKEESGLGKGPGGMIVCFFLDFRRCILLQDKSRF